MTDGSGALVELAEYMPFGGLNHHEGTVQVAHGFTGQRSDPTSGLILFPGRPYDPELGRFLQPDPFVQDPGDPQTLNRYSYCRNNPVNFVDPSGYGFFRWVARIVGAVIGAVVGFAIAGPEGAVTGATLGYALGDSVGTAIENRPRESAITLPPIVGPAPPSNLPITPGTPSQIGLPLATGPPAYTGAALPVLGVLAIPSDPSDAILWPALLIGGGAYILSKYGAPALKQALDAVVSNTQNSKEIVEGFHTTSPGRAALAQAAGNFSPLSFNPASRAGPAVYFSSSIEDSVGQARRTGITLRVQAQVKVLRLPVTPSYPIGQALGIGVRTVGQLFGYDAIAFPSAFDPTATVYAVFRTERVRPIDIVE